MVFLKIAIVAVAFVALLAFAQQRAWFKRIGLTASCEVVQPPFGASDAGGQWWSCREGVLSGYPNLERDNCRNKGIVSSHQVWWCPVPIQKPTFS